MEALTALTLKPRRAPRRRHLYAAVCALLLLGVGAPQPAPAQTPATESQVKAAYLYNFTKFARWPADTAAGEHFTICILGRDPFGRVLDATVAGESVDGKTVTVRRFTAAGDASGCRILYIARSQETELAQLLPQVRPGTLTVSDIDRFAERGGIIRFVNDGNRVRFEVNLSAAEHAGLVLSSELLKVAINVRRDQKAGQ